MHRSVALSLAVLGAVVLGHAAVGCAAASGGEASEDGADIIAAPDDGTPDGTGRADGGGAADVAAAPDTAHADAAVGPDGEPDSSGPPPQVCPPGLAGCIQGDLLVCTEDGTAFVLVPCDDGLVCDDGLCVECAGPDDCQATELCVDAACVVPPLEITTAELPPCLEGVAYQAPLEAVGGAPPYGWSKTQGVLPQGIKLLPEGSLTGLTTATGSYPLKLKVTDDLGEETLATLTLHVVEHGLHITTASPLPLATDGEGYQVQFDAIGGEPPYFWGLASGTLPGGLALGPSGLLSGEPSGSGLFEFELKAFDNALPPLTTLKAFKLPVTIAPLEIIAAAEVDLFVAKLIVLPLIIVVQGIPIPYDAQLEAKGGSKPYHWQEAPMPDLVQGFIPQSGLPEGLTISEDGEVSGAVTDTALAIDVTVPFVNLTLSGFFFGATCRDSQPVPYEETALYIIPTVPIAF